MCDTLLKSICRLCLKDNFSLTSIFTCRSPSLEPVSEMLEKIYDLKIYEGDGLPSQICVTCLWRVLEFDMYRKNVKYAEAEFRKLLSRTCNKSNEVSYEGADNVTDLTGEREMNVASDPMEGIGNDSEVSIKNEIDIVEWEMPESIPSQKNVLENMKNEAGEEVVKETEVPVKDIIEIEEEQQEEIQPEKDTLKISTGNVLEHNYPENDVQTEELEELQSTESRNIYSSEYFTQIDENFENISSKNTSSVVSTSGIPGKNKEMCEKSIKDDLFTQKEPFFSLKSKSCDNSAKSGSLSSGMAVQSKRKRFVCDICKQNFDTKQNLGRHVRIHYDDRPFKCVICGKSFKWESAKIKHELTHLKKLKENGRDKKRWTKKSYSCGICKKEFKTEVGLYSYSNVHKNKYLCTFCGKKCESKANLNVHLRIHTNEKPFSCEVCKRNFNHRSSLKRHLATHSDDRRFQCNNCDKTFKTKDQKNKHELHHLRRK